MKPPYASGQRVARILRASGLARWPGRWRPFREATQLVPVGRDIYGRVQQLTPTTAAAWQEMQSAAEGEGIELWLVSAFRSVAYQCRIIEHKLAAGQPLRQILRVNAPPGFSEHHTGRAVDVAGPDCKPLTEAFEQTATFAWLIRRARDFGFSMSYPRTNPFGLVYEPWHWACQEAGHQSDCYTPPNRR